MRGRRRSYVEFRPPRDERIIIYTSKERKKKWEKTVIDMEVKNYEEALLGLLELYELSAKYLGTRRIDEMIKKLNEVLGISVRLRIVR